jgi:hypothetical protein
MTCATAQDLLSIRFVKGTASAVPQEPARKIGALAPEVTHLAAAFDPFR